MQERITITRQTRFEDLPDFLSVEETRIYLGLGRSTLYDLIRSGTLACVRFGRVIRISRGVLARYVLAGEGESREAQNGNARPCPPGAMKLDTV